MSEGTGEPPTSTVMTSSANYSQVLFNNVSQAYAPDTVLSCSYTVTPQLIPHRRDWIGIFKVGWSTTRDYYTFLWAPPTTGTPGEQPLEQQVVFEAYYLPKEDGEFYQFCYVDSNGGVRGASTPFRFQSLTINSLETDLLVITTQEQVEQGLQEKEQLQREVDKQSETIGILQAELEDRLLELRRLRDSSNELGKTMKMLKQEREEEREQWRREREEERKHWETEREGERVLWDREKEAIMAQCGDKQDSLSKTEQESILRQREELQESLVSQQGKMERTLAKVAQLRQEREELRGKTETQEAEITRLTGTVRKLQQDKQQAFEEQRRLQDQIQLLQVDLQSSQKEAVKLSGELRAARAVSEGIEGLRRENRDLKRSLSEREDNMGHGDTENEGLSRQLQELQVQKEQMEQQLRELQGELRAQREQEEQRLRELQGELRAQREQEEQRLRDVGQKAEEAHDQLEYWKKGFEKVKEQGCKVEIQLTEVRQELENRTMEFEILKQEKEELTDENEGLRRDMKRLRQQMSARQPSPQPSISLLYSNPYSIPPVPTTGLYESPDLRYSDPFNTAGAPPAEPQEAVRQCQFCRELFPGISITELDTHEQSHKVCPYCSLLCDPMTQQQFEEHVYSHGD
ncbi:calcium-binding and coiled-coil domain-containing protein 2 isoform X1 [Amia ocellicauda]|uniref:calcium-binding and coiled-coil domain-containing protein 2 isoform X1 n=1 Tax=Amia ocellicauda TaxID=2972642 RepID=UPI003463B345